MSRGLLRQLACPGVVAALAIVFAGVAAAQETRADLIAQKEAEKARQLTPPQPSRVEQIIGRIEDNFVRPPGGFFPSFDSVYSGGGFTFGGGYRRLYGDRNQWLMTGLYSVKGYKKVEAATIAPDLARGRLALGANVGWRDATEVAFYGLGIDAPQENKTNFRFKESYVSGDARWNAAKYVFFSGHVGFEDYTLLPGEGSSPSIETRFTPATAPGLAISPSFWHSAGTAAIDWRTSPGYSRRGGYYGVTIHDYADTDNVLSFQRLDGEVIQHVPILRETWVLSFRGRVQTTLDDDDTVPFFLLPSLGSGHTLRAYPSWRFRDRHSMLLNGEFRWIPSRLALDMAIFYDTGKVAPRREDLDFSDLKSDWGVGVRFHGPVATPLRIEMAHGSEGWHLVFAGSAAF